MMILVDSLLILVNAAFLFFNLFAFTQLSLLNILGAALATTAMLLFSITLYSRVK